MGEVKNVMEAGGRVGFISLEFLIQLSGSSWLMFGEYMVGVEVLTGSCLDNAGCILVPVWRMKAVYWLPSGGYRLYIGSCLEDTGCILVHVWRMQAVYWLLSGECRLYIGSGLENAGCILAHVLRMQAVYWLMSGE